MYGTHAVSPIKTTSTKTVKVTNKPTTSTATKSVIPREMTDKDSKLLWFGEYNAWSCLKKNERVHKDAHQPFRLQNQYFDEEIGLHYNFFRYYEPDAGRFVNQDPIELKGGENLYEFSPNINSWFDTLGLSPRNLPEIASEMVIQLEKMVEGYTWKCWCIS